MIGLGKIWFVAKAVSSLRLISKRTWLILGAVALGLLVLLAWAGIVLLSWLWDQVPLVLDIGKRLMGEATT